MPLRADNFPFDGPKSGYVAPLRKIESVLVGWFEINNFDVRHDGHEWFVHVDDKMLPLTEIAVGIKQELER